MTLKAFLKAFRIRFAMEDDRSAETRTTHEGVSGGVNGGVFEEPNGLLKLIREQPGINSKQMVKLSGKSQRTVERGVKQLKEAGEIEFRGASKTCGYWGCG